MRIEVASPKRIIICMLAVSALLLSACSTLDRKNAVPPELRRETTVLGIPNARFFSDQPAPMQAEQEQALIREAKYLHVKPGEALPTAYLLSLRGAATMARSERVCWSAGPRMAIAPALNSSPA